MPAATTPIRRADLVESIAAALQYISYYHPTDYIAHLARAYEREQSPAAKDAIAQILTNSRMCAEGHRPICQDTGIVTMLLSGFLGVGVDRLAFRPMRERRSLTLAIVSIGVSFILENLARFIWGNEIRGYKVPVLRGMEFWGIRVGKEQIIILLVSLIFMVLVQLLLRATRMGKAMRAVADNPMLASVKGVDSEQVILRTSYIGAALAGAAGVMVGIDTIVEPLMGFKLIFSIFASAILGGIGSATTAVGGAFFVGLAGEVSLIWLPATYKSAIGFGMIVCVLLFRPEGLFRRRG